MLAKKDKKVEEKFKAISSDNINDDEAEYVLTYDLKRV